MKKVILTKISDDIRYFATPKSNFIQWCFKNGDKLAEAANEGDFDLLDDIWFDIKQIFNLNYAGYPLD
ncbi:hypothetical protein SDC9_46826 [bioreactor metagenome]|uniref:Uncharacterized protein n=1 Tax=bioreactor metagenome TaxID=1076179 RepID=A0A644WAJ3_9ZZZZ